MKVIFHDDFYTVYTSDPAAEEGRMEAIVSAIQSDVTLIQAKPASEAQLLAAHTLSHVNGVRARGLYDIAALAAGGAVQAAEIGLTEPCFALIRPPGHHASKNTSWGFCYFNNMSVALLVLKQQEKIRTAHILDFDLHYGDGNVNILGKEDWVTLHNPEDFDPKRYMTQVEQKLDDCTADIIGISAGFDNHRQDWGGLLRSDDYKTMGKWVLETARRNSGGCFAILEGGYNHRVLGQNVKALLEGMSPEKLI